MIKYFKFTGSIRLGNFTNTFCKKLTNVKKVGGCYTPSSIPSPHRLARFCSPVENQLAQVSSFFYISPLNSLNLVLIPGASLQQVLVQVSKTKTYAMFC